ncbi:MAG: PilZ domain-containing protein [Hyphomicrobiales bacterium]|nr:PilZ domain-containing protein [Hyphomicrobiales bacterium]
MAARKKVSESPPGADHAERRSQPRRRVLKGAIIRFNKGYGAFECVVRNLSESGAKLTFGETSAIPVAFDLKIAGDEQVRPARIRWRSPDSVGVSFA